MYLIFLTLILAGLKFFEVGFMEDVSWWWVAGAFFLTFIWFEFFERILGYDKKRLHEEFDEMQKKSKTTLGQKK